MSARLPFTALLRCKMFAQVRERVVAPSTCFTMLGTLQAEEKPHLWRDDGRWREDGQPHAFDIVGIVMGRDAENVVQVEPYGPAAGNAKDLTPKKGKA